MRIIPGLSWITPSPDRQQKVGVLEGEVGPSLADRSGPTDVKRVVLGEEVRCPPGEQDGDRQGVEEPGQ